MPIRRFRLPHPSAVRGGAALAAPARWPLRLDVLVLAALALLGLIHLAMPLLFDQAVFMMGAHRMAAGAALYRDFWDVKQPGIYFFYWLAGRLFGFDERGVHLLELLVVLAAAAFQQRALRRICDDARLAALSPLLTWGLYYAAAGSVHMTQVESLAGIPLLLELEWALAGGESGSAAAWFGAGVAGGASLVLKLVFAPLVGVLWVVGASAALARPGAGRWPAMARGTALFALGVAVPLAATAGYLHMHGVLDQALYLSFVYPRTILGHIMSLRLAVLEDGVGWFMARWAGVLALGAIGLWLGAARGQGRRLVAYALWITVGLGVILVQRWSWWSYHYMLLAVPTGVLAARGLDLLAQGLARLEPARAGRLRTGALVTCVLLLTATSLGSLGFKTALLARSRFAISSADRSHFQQRAESDVREISDEVRFLRAPGTRQGALFTLGDALYNWLSGRDFPGERLGGLLTPNATRADWDRWGDMLDRQAPAWIFVQDDFRNLLLREPAFGSRFTAAFANGYVFSHHSRRGSWYERTGPATKPLPAAGR